LAGFHAIECSVQQLQKAIEQTSLSNVADALQQAGVVIAQCSGILPAGPVLPSPLLIPESRFQTALGEMDASLQVASDLHCPLMSVVLNPRVDQQPEAGARSSVLRLQELARRCENHGLGLAVEFVGVRSGLAPDLDGHHELTPTLGAAVAIIEDVDRSNVGLLFDTYHWYAGGGDLAEIVDLPRGLVRFVHVNDVPRDVDRDELRDSLRELPGKGVLDLASTLHALTEIGYSSCVSVEVFREDLWKLPAEVVAREAYDALSSYFPLGRPSSGEANQ